MPANIGPKIGIDGEKEYRKQINDIIQTQKTLKSEMDAVSSAWDKSTSAEKKAKQQKEILNKQIENQSKKVEELNKMLQASTEKYGENDSRTLKWKEAVNGATAELNGMKKQLADVPSTLDLVAAGLHKVGDKLQEVGKGISDFGSKMTKSVTAPIVGIGAAAVKSFQDVDEGLDTIIVKTGATGESLDDMQQAMQNIATSIPTDFATAGEAVGEVNTRFGSTGKELEDLSKAFIQFASLNGTDVSGSIDSVQAAMQAFNVDTDKAANVLDMLNKAGQNTGVSVDRLTSDLLANATTFSQMGFGINQSINFLSNLNKNGLDSSAVMGGLSKALQNATKNGVPLNKALSDLQTDMANAKDDTEAMQLAMDLFGNKAGPKLAEAIKEGSLSFNELENVMLGFSGSVDTTFEATLDAPDQLTVVMNDLKVAGADLGGVMMEMLVPAIEKVTELVETAVDWFTNLDDDQKELIVTIGSVVAAVGPALFIIGKVISIGGVLVSTLGTIVSAINPVTLVIAAVVAAGVLLWKNWDTIKAKAQEMAAAITEKWDELKTAASTKFSEIKTAIYDKWTEIKTQAVTKLNDLISTVQEKFEGIRTRIDSKIEAVKDIVRNGVEKLKGFFDFEWKLPEIKLPHFSLTGEWSWNPPSTPTLGVEWYAKAMDNGMILNRPTIFGAANGKLLAGGEAGAEVVVGANSLASMIAGAVASAMAPSTNNYGGNTINFYGAPGQDLDLLARKLANIINGDVASRGAVWA